MIGMGRSGGTSRQCRVLSRGQSMHSPFQKKISVEGKPKSYVKDHPSYAGSIFGHSLKKWKSECAHCANSELPPAVEYNSLMNAMKALLSFLTVFYALTRPYAFLGTLSGVVSASLIAIENLSDLSTTFLIDLFKALAASGFMMIYGSGINQLFDVDIDKINKPYLPLASGAMSRETGITIVTTCALLVFVLIYHVGSWPLQCGILLTFLLVSAYSVNLPFLRWKKHKVAAAFSIVAYRGIVLQLSIFFHMQTFVLGRQANFSRSLAFGTIVVSIISLVIAIYKDISDIEGDKKFGINSFAASIGKKQVFWICVYLLVMAYTFAVAFGATSSHQWSKLITIFSHAVLGSIVWKRAKSVDLKNNCEITSFYMLVWKLLYVEHLLVPFVR